VDGRSSSLLVHVPSGPARPTTFFPLLVTRVTAPKVPDDTFTVTGTLGATLVAPSAGSTSSTAGVAVGAGELGERSFAESAETPWHALSMRQSATSAADEQPHDRDLADVALTSYRLSGHVRWPMHHRTAMMPFIQIGRAVGVGYARPRNPLPQ
jgi:hypothetical protein